MRDWINRFFIAYGESFNTFLYILILMIFMWIIKRIGA